MLLVHAVLQCVLQVLFIKKHLVTLKELNMHRSLHNVSFWLSKINEHQLFYCHWCTMFYTLFIKQHPSGILSVRQLLTQSAREITAVWTLCVSYGAYLRLWDVKSKKLLHSLKCVYYILISSAESQKGVNAIQWCSTENQKCAIAIDFAQQ